jgi:hypothetical protein
MRMGRRLAGAGDGGQHDRMARMEPRPFVRRNRFQGELAIALPLASLLLGGCAGQTNAQGSDASVAGPDANGNDSSDLDATDASEERAGSDAECFSTCPLQEPEAGDPCSTTTCAYAVDASSGCARAYSCLGLQFQAAITECLQAQGAGCPRTAADIEAGQACDPAAPTCGYPGTICQCAPTAVADASFTWYCFTIAAGCPPTPPLPGTPCAAPLLYCAYGANPCAARGFGFFECVCGVWNALGFPPCK